MGVRQRGVTEGAERLVAEGDDFGGETQFFPRVGMVVGQRLDRMPAGGFDAAASGEKDGDQHVEDHVEGDDGDMGREGGHGAETFVARMFFWFIGDPS